MKISQLARNQTMMYNFIRKNSNSSYASQMQGQLPGFGEQSSTDEPILDVGTMREQLEKLGLKGRTVREMAKNHMENLQKSQESTNTDLSTQSLAQQFIARVQYTPISDKATSAMQELALQDAMESMGTMTPSAERLDRVAVIQEHLDSVAPSKRAAALNSMNKVWESELERIGEYIKEKDPSWNNWGDTFDTNILKGYQPGINTWA